MFRVEGLGFGFVWKVFACLARPRMSSVPWVVLQYVAVTWEEPCAEGSCLVEGSSAGYK